MPEWEARSGEAEPGRGREFKNHPLPCLIEPERFLTRNREVSITRPSRSLKRLSRHRLHQPPSQLPNEGWGRGRSGEGEQGPHRPGPRSTPSPASSQAALRTRSSGFSSLCPHKGPLCPSRPGNRPPTSSRCPLPPPHTQALPTAADSQPSSRRRAATKAAHDSERRSACQGPGSNYRGHSRARRPHLAVRKTALLPVKPGGKLRDREATNRNLNHLERSYKYNNESFVKYNFIQKPGKNGKEVLMLFQAKSFKGVLPEPGVGTQLPPESWAALQAPALLLTPHGLGHPLPQFPVHILGSECRDAEFSLGELIRITSLASRLFS